MPTYFSIRDVVISRLEHDIEAQESGRFSEIGIHFDTIADEFDLLPHVVARDSPEWDRLNTAMAFWSAWIGARFDGWRNSYGVSEQDWPQLARRLVEDLASDREVSDPAIRRYFHPDAINPEDRP
jgi:hypothetical protein